LARLVCPAFRADPLRCSGVMAPAFGFLCRQVPRFSKSVQVSDLKLNKVIDDRAFNFSCLAIMVLAMLAAAVFRRPSHFRTPPNRRKWQESLGIAFFLMNFGLFCGQKGPVFHGFSQILRP